MEVNTEKLKNIGLEGYSPQSDMVVLSNGKGDYSVVKISGEDVIQVDIMPSMKSDMDNDKMNKEMDNDKMDKDMDNDKMKKDMDMEAIKTMVDEAVKSYMKNKEMENNKSKNELENNKSYNETKDKEIKQLEKLEVTRKENKVESKNDNVNPDLEKYLVDVS